MSSAEPPTKVSNELEVNRVRAEVITVRAVEFVSGVECCASERVGVARADQNINVGKGVTDVRFSAIEAINATD